MLRKLRLLRQDAQHVLRPPDGRLFVQNAFFQDHVLDACFARERAAKQKVPFFNGPVVRQLFLVMCNLDRKSVV